MNDTNFTGRLTAEPELKQTTGGISVCSFTLAVKRPRRKDITDFINFVAWRQQAEFLCKYFKKGDAVEVSGCLTSRKYQDANGNNRVAFEVECDTVDFALTTKKQTTEQPIDTADLQYEELGEDEELPF